ncbi:MAG: short-chain dehydrogenase [Actinobacteria bacterium RBG_13_63_9]|nr:MAG: short-chain dehydrogenase [Actinobacteria bacterium RBG_13_63_9]
MPKEVVILTGANNGIGLGLAKALAAHGFRLACLDLSGENLSGLRFFMCDVADPAQVEAAVIAVVAEWGRVDILVNNACLAIFAPFEEKSIADTRREFEVNYFGYVNLISAVLPHMKAQGSGIIHNFSSTVGTSGFAGIYGYASTKGAIEALTRTLAIEFAPYGIAVNIVHPPLTRTKSSAPLGVPAKFMADPSVVGRKLAKRIRSTKAVVTPGLAESLGVFMTKLIPEAMGKFLSARAAAAREAATTRPPDGA